MKKISPFAQKVLDFMEPDPARQKIFIQEASLAEICSSQSMKAFVERIGKAARSGEKVLVAGDYDCDGILSTSIMTFALRSLSIEAGYYIPDRIKDGYGLSEKTVELAAQRGYSLIVTVDNGVRAASALARAKELGIEVIVTDHHLMTEPVDAEIIVHPDTMGEPFSTLCGAGVAYECARALGADQERFLIWAAIASVADCMEVTGQTRAIISKGIDLFNKKGEPHLSPFVRSVPITEQDAAFQIAPRINAIGRLADRANANTFVKYLETENPNQIQAYAAQVCDLNEQRKHLSEQISARAQALAVPWNTVLMAMDPSFHEGVIGLAAGSLSGSFGKPAIVCTLSQGVYKGSMRSPKGFHCLDFLEQFDGFLALGGHAQAAGFSISPDRWEEFEQFVVRKGNAMNWQPEEEETLEIDPDEITVENVRSLDALRPFGTGFSAPRFSLCDPQISRAFDLSGGRHRKFTLSNHVSMLLFNQSSTDMAQKPESIAKVCGTLSVSSYRGAESADFLIDEIEYRD